MWSEPICIEGGRLTRTSLQLSYIKIKFKTELELRMSTKRENNLEITEQKVIKSDY